MNKKLLYENPSAELLVVRFEEDFLQASNYGAKGAAGADLVNSDEDYDL